MQHRTRILFESTALFLIAGIGSAIAGNFGTREVAAAVTLQEAHADPGRFAGRLVRLTGTISDVCQKKGCWLVLGEGPTSVRVRFQDYAFFVPRDSAARQAVVEGILEPVELSEEMVAHLAGETGKPADAIARKTVQLTAVGVSIEGYADQAPPAEPPRSGSATSED